MLTVEARSQFRGADREAFRRLGIIEQKVKPLYRAPTDEEIRVVAVDDQVTSKYADLLKQPKSGITKLILDRGCSDNSRIVSASEDCLKYSMPGGGSSFSFRTKTYRIPSVADILYADGGFQASGALTIGIFVKLGDVPLDQVTLRSPGMRFLADFIPPPQYDDAKILDKKLLSGISVDGYLYRRGLFSRSDTTYALRTVAYSGNHWKAVEGVTYNELDYDKRKDITTVFRMVDLDKEGNATIIWRILDERSPPEIIRPKIKNKKGSKNE